MEPETLEARISECSRDLPPPSPPLDRARPGRPASGPWRRGVGGWVYGGVQVSGGALGCEGMGGGDGKGLRAARSAVSGRAVWRGLRANGGVGATREGWGVSGRGYGLWLWGSLGSAGCSPAAGPGAGSVLVGVRAAMVGRCALLAGRWW